MTTRREFLGTPAALLVARYTRLVSSQARLPLGFSTLGCPQWSWSQILDFAAARGYAAVELRGILTNMDLTKVPELAPEHIGDAKRQLAAHGLSVSCLGASAQMHDMDPVKHAAQLDEAHRFIDLAQALGAPYVRVFGNEYVKDVPRDEMLAHIAGALHELGDYAKGKGVEVIIESHGDFTDSPSLLELLRLLTGTGEVPVKRQIAALVKIGYRGFYSFEWEKRWHPEIEEPERAIAQFAEVAARYLREARRE